MNVVFGAAALSILYAYKYRLELRHLICALSLGATFYFYGATDGRGGFYFLLLFVALAILLPALLHYPGFSLILISLPVILLGATFWIASQAGNKQLNDTLSFRPIIYRNFIESFSTPDLLLSASVKQFDAIRSIDNSYLHLLIGLGLPVFAFICILWGFAMRELMRTGRTLEIAFLCTTAGYGYSESILLRMENVFVIFFWLLILRSALAGSSDTLRIPPAANCDSTARSRHQMP